MAKAEFHTRELMKHTIMTVKVHGERELAVRMKVASFLLVLAARVLGCRIEVVHVPAADPDAVGHPPGWRPPPDIKPDPYTMWRRD